MLSPKALCRHLRGLQLRPVLPGARVGQPAVLGPDCPGGSPAVCWARTPALQPPHLRPCRRPSSHQLSSPGKPVPSEVPQEATRPGDRRAYLYEEPRALSASSSTCLLLPAPAPAAAAYIRSLADGRSALPATRALCECQGGRATSLGCLHLPQSLWGLSSALILGEQTRKPIERGAEAGSKGRVEGTKYRQG